MKLKSIFIRILIGTTMTAIIMGISLPLSAKTAIFKSQKYAQDADYWFDKGALCATYGNDRAAIKYFQNAISLNPNHSRAYFARGISHGQLGEFRKALVLINRALEMEPQNGLYLYGRGRVYLLAGEEEKALQDFKRAAELDDEDAQFYLELTAHTK
jgi:tetratricopeptide (TPR) repeat protein